MCIVVKSSYFYGQGLVNSTAKFKESGRKNGHLATLVPTPYTSPAPPNHHAPPHHHPAPSRPPSPSPSLGLGKGYVTFAESGVIEEGAISEALRKMLRLSHTAMARWLATGLRTAPRLTSHTRHLSSQTPELRKDGDDLISYIGDITPTPLHNYDLLEQAAKRFAHHTAMECAITGKSYTYGVLQDLWRRCGGALQRRGLQRGDVASILMLNSPDFAVIIGGVFAAGATPSPINPTYTAGEVARQVSSSGAKVLVADARLAPLAEAALALIPHPQPVLMLAGGTDGGREDLLAEAGDKDTPFAGDVKVDDEDDCVLLYSSGTTGPPKGAPTRQGSIRNNLPAVLHQQINAYQPTTGDSQETVLGMMPFFHAWGLYTVLNCSLLQGAKVVTLPMFIPDLFLSSMVKHKVGVLHVVPPLIQFLVGHPDVTPNDLKSLRVVMCAAAPCPAPAAHALKEKAPNPLFFQEAYGMTETMPTHFTPLGGERLGSCGPLLPGVRARVMDLASDTPVGTDTPGELWVKAPGVMAGYKNNKEATQEVFTSDGWLKTGDVVTYDKDGYFYVVDRIKELIKVKGNQVSPSEIEAELCKLPGVADAGVVGIQDERAGEVPRAYVVRSDAKLTEKEVEEFVAKRLAPHKQLAGGVCFVEELPKSPAGKLLRRHLQEKASQE